MLTESFEPNREATQLQVLVQLIKGVRKSGETPVLSISRDGVALALAPWSIFEMAGVASISILSNGKKLSTVYLAKTPQSNHKRRSIETGHTRSTLLIRMLKTC